MSSKVVEADAGVHSLAMAVAVSVSTVFPSYFCSNAAPHSLSPAGVCMVGFDIRFLVEYGIIDLFRFYLHRTLYEPTGPEPRRVRERLDFECNSIP